MGALEEAFPDATPLLPPAGSRERSRADALLRLERRLFSDWLSWLCSAWCALRRCDRIPPLGQCP
jgi:glutathione S-transferase